MIDITYTVIALIIVKCTVASEFRNWGMFQISDFGKSPNLQVFCFYNGKTAWITSWHPSEAMRP